MVDWRDRAGEVTTLPNLVSLSRLPLIALIVLLLDSVWRYPLFVLVVLSDGLDGWLARRLDQSTELGAMLDPALDKITGVVLFVGLFPGTGLPWEYLVLFFARDLYVLSLGLLVPVTGIPDTSKIKARPLGKAVTNLQFFALVAMLVPSTVATEAWSTVDAPEASLAVESDADVRADPERLRTLLENCFRNSVDHGGEDVRVAVEPLPDGGFAVTDDGPGVDPDERDAVFDRGYTTANDGTGFGLAIVRDIADAHGWTTAVTESAGGGARFEFVPSR